MKTYESRVRAYERQDITRSDAQAIVDAEDMTMTTRETKHTPGPWKWMKGAEGGYRLHAGPSDGKKTLVMRSGNRGASLKDVPNESDAALIARAPDLLAENKRLREVAVMVDTVIQEWRETGREPTYGQWQDLQEVARAALAKGAA